jgi:uncharacterized protein
MNNSPRHNFVVMMVKSPTCGGVKSRLAADIGMVAATSAYRTMMYNSIRTLARDPRWRFALTITPDSAVFEPIWPQNIALINQGRGDLGHRMQRIMNSMPPGKVVIIGSDIAAMRPGHIARALKKLGGVDAVFSPAEDGGYSLVGLKRSPRIPGIFDNVRWSSSHTLEDTLRNLTPLKTGYIEEVNDIDTGADWESWQKGGRAGRLCL